MFIKGETDIHVHRWLVCAKDPTNKHWKQRWTKIKFTEFQWRLQRTCLRPNVHTIHAKFYVIFLILFRADRVDSMHIGTQGMFPQIQHWMVICPAEFSSNPDKNSTAWCCLVTLKTLISLLFVNYWHIKQDYIFNMNEYEYELINCIHKLHIFGFCWIVNNYFIFIIKRFDQS